MKKVTYKCSNLFTLKHYNDSNLNCQSYEYPTIYSIRSAIIGSIIQLDGIEKTKDLFYKVKNSIIYIQYPKEYKLNGTRLKRFANSYYKLKEEDKTDLNKLTQNNYNTTIGFRQYYSMPEIVFYITNSIPNLDLYLKNIDWIGTAESLVYLDNIQETNELENVMIKWDNKSDVKIYEQHDYNTKTTFDTVYMYSDKYKHIHNTFMCYVKDLNVI